MGAVYHSSWLSQLHRVILHPLKVLPIEASVRTLRAIGGAFNKDQPVSVIDNSVSDPLSSLVEVSFEVRGSPGCLERLILDIDGKDIPSVPVSVGKLPPSLNDLRLTMGSIVPESVRCVSIMFKRMHIKHNHYSFGCHVVNYLVHNFQGPEALQVIVAVPIITAPTELYGSWNGVVEDQVKVEGHPNRIKLVGGEEIDDEFIVNGPESMDSGDTSFKAKPRCSFEEESFLVNLEDALFAGVDDSRGGEGEKKQESEQGHYLHLRQDIQ